MECGIGARRQALSGESVDGTNKGGAGKRCCGRQ